MAVDELEPAEFCALERELIAGMAMRKKRNVRMDEAQQLKLRLLSYVEAVNPPAALFTATLSEAVLDVSDGLSTGPAQAVASDIQLDWELNCSSPGFRAWLREAAVKRTA